MSQVRRGLDGLGQISISGESAVQICQSRFGVHLLDMQDNGGHRRVWTSMIDSRRIQFMQEDLARSTEYIGASRVKSGWIIHCYCYLVSNY